MCGALFDLRVAPLPAPPPPCGMGDWWVSECVGPVSEYRSPLLAICRTYGLLCLLATKPSACLRGFLSHRPTRNPWHNSGIPEASASSCSDVLPLQHISVFYKGLGDHNRRWQHQGVPPPRRSVVCKGSNCAGQGAGLD